MANTSLLVRLRELHEELSVINDDLKQAEQIDEQTINSLGQLVTDVSDLVDRAREIGVDEKNLPEYQALLERIDQFDSEHTRVNRFLNHVAEMLTENA